MVDRHVLARHEEALLLLVVVLAANVADAARHKLVERQRRLAHAAHTRPRRCNGAMAWSLGHDGFVSQKQGIIYIYDAMGVGN